MNPESSARTSRVSPLLARKAADAGVVYSLAYGDQPALICELVVWARQRAQETFQPAGNRSLNRRCTGSAGPSVYRHDQGNPERARRHPAQHPDLGAMCRQEIRPQLLEGADDLLKGARVPNRPHRARKMPQDDGRNAPCPEVFDEGAAAAG